VKIPHPVHDPVCGQGKTRTHEPEFQDPQERYDLFMKNFTERTWTMVTISEAIKGAAVEKRATMRLLLTIP
jgi:hypothetical protein